MNKCNIYFLLFASLIFCACNQIKKEDFLGEWIIYKATFKGIDVQMASKTLKLYLLPSEFQHNFTIIFNQDSTIDFPGMKTKDIPCRWKIKDKKLIVVFDTARFKNSLLLELDTLQPKALLTHDSLLQKRYEFKRVSILRKLDFDSLKTPVNIYTGVYNIKKSNNSLILTSPTTQFELLNLDKVFNEDIEDMFKSLRNKVPHPYF